MTPTPGNPQGRTRGALSIKDVAERTGLAAATIRVWEQRYGFPDPARTESGYRRYDEADVEVLRRAHALRDEGLSVPAALERAQRSGHAGEQHPSIYAAVAGGHPGRPQVLRKSTLVALARAIEHEALAHAAAPVVVGAFQHEVFYRQVQRRYHRMARYAASTVVFADFEQEHRHEGGPVEMPIAAEDKLGNEWAVVVDAPNFAAALLAWEIPGDTAPLDTDDLSRRFESVWTLDPLAVRRAALAGARLAGRRDPAVCEEIEELLAGRPASEDSPGTALTQLTNRMVAYLEAA